MLKQIPLAISIGLALFGSQLRAQEEVKYEERDGVKYQTTKRVVQRLVSETRLEPREKTVYTERYTTDMKEMARSYQVPVTEYHWVSCWERSWNPFNGPYIATRMVPQTRWETRTEVVKVPVTNREIVPEKRTEHVPVTAQRIAEDVYEQRVAVGVGGASSSDPFAQSGGQSLASRETVGGVSKMDSDPPRTGTAWRDATTKR